MKERNTNNSRVVSPNGRLRTLNFGGVGEEWVFDTDSQTYVPRSDIDGNRKTVDRALKPRGEVEK